MADRPNLPPAERGLTADNTLMTKVTGFYRKFVALSFVVANKDIVTILKKWTLNSFSNSVSVMSDNKTITSVISVPEKIRHTTFYLNTRKTVRCFNKVVNLSNAIIIQHIIPEFIKTLAAREPSRGCNHGQISRI